MPQLGTEPIYDRGAAVRLIVERLDGDRLVAHEPKRTTKRGVYLGKRGAIAGLEPATTGVTGRWSPPA